MRPCLISAWRIHAAKRNTQATAEPHGQPLLLLLQAAAARRQLAAAGSAGGVTHRSKPRCPDPTGQCRRGRWGPRSPARGSAPWRALRHERQARRNFIRMRRAGLLARSCAVSGRRCAARTLELGLAEAHLRRRSALHGLNRRHRGAIGSGGHDEGEHLSVGATAMPEEARASRTRAEREDGCRAARAWPGAGQTAGPHRRSPEGARAGRAGCGGPP